MHLGERTAEGDLPFRIELWDMSKPDTMQRMLAQACSAALARAMFKAALAEYPDRRITLGCCAGVIADTHQGQRVRALTLRSAEYGAAII